jgi:hypothetical protein
VLKRGLRVPSAGRKWGRVARVLRELAPVATLPLSPCFPSIERPSLIDTLAIRK